MVDQSEAIPEDSLESQLKVLPEAQPKGGVLKGIDQSEAQPEGQLEGFVIEEVNQVEGQ